MGPDVLIILVLISFIFLAVFGSNVLKFIREIIKDENFLETLDSVSSDDLYSIEPHIIERIIVIKYKCDKGKILTVKCSETTYLDYKTINQKLLE